MTGHRGRRLLPTSERGTNINRRENEEKVKWSQKEETRKGVVG